MCQPNTSRALDANKSNSIVDPRRIATASSPVIPMTSTGPNQQEHDVQLLYVQLFHVQPEMSLIDGFCDLILQIARSLTRFHVPTLRALRAFTFQIQGIVGPAAAYAHTLTCCPFKLETYLFTEYLNQELGRENYIGY